MGRPLTELRPENARLTLSVNCLSNFYTLHHFLPGMVGRNRGHVVTVASLMGMMVSGSLSDYSASKSAQMALADALRLELRSAAPNVNTLLVCPWAINTGMFKGIRESGTIGERLNKLAFPELDQERVAKAILNGIEQGEKFLVMPAVLAWLPYLVRLLPPEVADTVTDFMGGNSSMDSFKGRSAVNNPLLAGSCKD